jgi:hypothetical protein
MSRRTQDDDDDEGNCNWNKINVPLPLRSSAIHRLAAICIGYVMFTPTNGNKRPGPPPLRQQQQRQQFSQADVTVLRELRDVWKIRQRI